MDMKDVKYEQITPLQFSDSLLEECATLYSEHYGVWSQENPNTLLRGKNVRLSVDKLRTWFNNQKSNLYIAKDRDLIIGYAIAMRIKVSHWTGGISWVTQLVVHTDYRHEDIAKNILYSIWCESSNYAWGIISANPYAIRALEKATRRRSDPNLIKNYIKKIIAVGEAKLPYIDENTEYCVDSTSSRINTEFFVDHSNMKEMLQRVISKDVPWLLGELEEGWEWIAFTFNKQIQIELSPNEITEILNTSEMVNRQAYERMQLSENHAWMKYTDREVEFIIRECGLNANKTVYDFGCGNGRHAILLAKRNLCVTGIDYVRNNIEQAEKQATGINNICFLNDDCRTVSLPKKADAIVCLYDVIGSFIEDLENKKILQNISNHLVHNGVAIISVMNFEMTNHYAKHRFKFSENPNVLLNLAASQTMENTGNVFDPDYYLIDDETNITYRKERFEHGNELPVELIVRDKRYTKEEIERLCESVGLRVEYSRFVNAKDWETNLAYNDQSAKEILVKCLKI